MKIPDARDRGSAFNDLRAHIGEEHFRNLKDRHLQRLSYSPVIVFMGKTGAGKSSLCNALFGKDAFKVSDVAVGTRDIQIETKPGGLTIVDVPGVGEGGANSRKYEELYRSILRSGVTDARSGVTHEVDAIVWLIKSNDRALEIDKDFFDGMFKRFCSKEQLARLTFAVSQADAIEPIRDEGSWDRSVRHPGAKQAKNLDEKRHQVAEMFDVESNHVIEFSATEHYNLERLLERIVSTLPRGRAPLVVEVAEAAEEHANRGRSEHDRVHVVSDRTRRIADKDFWEQLADVAKEVLPGPLVRIVVENLPTIVKTISSGIKSAFRSVFR